ncbi:MAG: T9SS type A sorting domain-containing protein [Flavobacteriaceae bacterium]
MLFIWVQEEVDPPFSDDPPSFKKHVIADMSNGAYFVLPVDLNEDGNMDILGSPSGHLRWFQNDGAGNFTAHPVDSGSNFYSFAVADIDGDMDLDIVSGTGTTILLHQNDGDENFETQTIHDHSGIILGNIRSVVFADIDGDMDLDVVSSFLFGGTVQWHENYGAGVFTKEGGGFNLNPIYDNLNSPYSVSSADFDGDGDNDVVTPSTDGRVYWHENAGEFGFLCTKVIFAVEDSRAWSVVTADVDEDTHPDIVLTSRGDDSIRWFQNDGFGNFTNHLIFDMADGASTAAIGDLDNDNDLDVLSSSISDFTVRWYENNGEEKFKTHTLFALDFDTNPDSIATADLDNDGDLDVIAATSGDIHWFENSTITLTEEPPAFPEATTIYPNPTTRVLHISYATATTTTYELIDITGKLLSVVHKTGQEHTIDVSSLSKGNYLLKATTGSETT